MEIATPVPAIDVHTHLFPERLAVAVRRALTDAYGWSFEHPTDPDEFSAFVRARGIESFAVLPYAHKPGMARSLNSWVAELATRKPEVIGFACVNQDDADPRAVLEEAFASGLRGLKLHHQVQNVAPDDRRLDVVYETMLAHDLPLLVHAGRGPTDNGLVGVARFRAAMERFPDLRVCVAHLGAPEAREFVALLDEFPRMYLDTSGTSNLSLRGLGLEDHVDRILFASDAPNLPSPYERTITRITDLGLGPDAERKVFRENALRFLG